MPTDVVMPQMGESIFEGTITKWLKKPGDKVNRDEPLFEISTDKVDAEIPSPTAGVLQEIKVPEGTTVQVNTVVGTIAAEGEAAGAPAAAPQPQAAAPATAKTEAAPRAPEPAKAAAIAGEEQEDESTVLQFPQGKGEEGERVRSSPLVRRIARENKVDLNQVRGTGLGGRITKEDIIRFVERPAAQRPAASAPAVHAPAASAQPAYQPGTAAPAMPSQQPIAIPGEVMPMSAMRKKIAERMVQSKRTSAHVHSVFEVDLTRVMAVRQREKASFGQRTGTRLTMMPFFCRAAIESIRNWPIINASVEGDNLHYHRSVNLGIAVSLDWGLIVPVIKRADEMNFVGVARAIQDLADRARTKRLSVDDVQGGTFTITNPGIFGSLFGTPIINQPQVAILGVGTIEKRAVVRHDAIAIRPMVYLALSFDHRVIDGAVADQFTGRIKRVLEEWAEPVV